jgi:hypothetical protein
VIQQQPQHHHQYHQQQHYGQELRDSQQWRLRAQTQVERQYQGPLSSSTYFQYEASQNHGQVYTNYGPWVWK